jgi:gamma-glutamyl hercynylcysteine S-oxide synthase
MLAASKPVEVRQALLNRFFEARKETDKIFALVSPDSLYARPIPERHRIAFYLGHLEAFDWNLLQPRLPDTKVFDPEFDRLFAFGIDPVGDGLPSDQPSDWPVQAQIERYGNRVRTALDSALADRSFDEWLGDDSPQVLLNTAIEHRLMHAETLAYMLHQLPFDQKRKQSQAAVPDAAPAQPDLFRIPAGRASLGIPSGDPSRFGWDNEYEAIAVDVAAFSIDRYKVTNGDYLKFVEAGGYTERGLWSSAAWDWKTRDAIEHPLFWSKTDAGWRYRGMFEEIPLPLDWPVYVSHAEASAYASWIGKRLPTEAEWHRAAQGAPEPRGLNLARWDPSPVNAFSASRSGFGVEGLIANGWEWTASLFEPFPGFRPFPFYAGYSANFFDGMHYVMKGGSPRTERSMLRRSFRNWFQPHYQYVYAGFRCVGE